MPKETLAARKVKITDENKQILQIYVDCIAKLNLVSKPTTPKIRPGTLNRLKDYLGDKININLNSKQIELPVLSRELEAQAKDLFGEYRDELNLHTKQTGQDAANVCAEEIANHFVLIRELMLRLILEALSCDSPLSTEELQKIAFSSENKLKTQDDKFINEFENEFNITYRHAHITAIREFIKKLSEEGFLIAKSITGDKVTTFGIFFDSEHSTWINLFSEIINTTAFIQSNKLCIRKTLDLIYTVKLRIISHLICELTGRSKISPEHFRDDMLSSKLNNIEKEILKKITNENNSHQAKVALILNYFGEKEAEEKSILKENTSKTARLRELYTFLAKTELLKDILAEFDSLNTTMGWIAILTGVVNMRSLAQILISYGTQSSKLLSISLLVQKQIASTDICIGLHKSGRIDSSNFAFEFQDWAEKIALLADRNMKEKLIKFIDEKLNKLIDLSTKWEEDIQLVDIDNRNRLMKFLRESPASKDKQTQESRPAPDKNRLPLDSSKALEKRTQLLEAVFANINNLQLNQMHLSIFKNSREAQAFSTRLADEHDIYHSSEKDTKHVQKDKFYFIKLTSEEYGILKKEHPNNQYLLLDNNRYIVIFDNKESTNNFNNLLFDKYHFYNPDKSNHRHHKLVESIKYYYVELSNAENDVFLKNASQTKPQRKSEKKPRESKPSYYTLPKPVSPYSRQKNQSNSFFKKLLCCCNNGAVNSNEEDLLVQNKL